MIKLLVLIGAMVFSFPVTAMNQDVCSYFYNVATYESREIYKTDFQIINQRLINSNRNKALSDLNENEEGFYFTNKPGYYFNLDCTNVKDGYRIIKTGMFSIGDKFKPMKKIEFSDFYYYYGQRLSGLMSFVRVDKLTKIEKDTIYFVNRTLEMAYFCTQDGSCDGESREFTIRSHYATLPKSKYDFKNSKDCKKYDVVIHQYYKKEKLIKVPYNNTQIIYCHSNEYEERKIYKIDHDDVVDQFTKTPIIGSLVLLSSDELRKISSSMVMRKQCGQTFYKIRTRSNEAGIKLGFDFNPGYIFINGELSDNIIEQQKIISTYSDKYLFTFYGFSVEQSKISILKENSVNDIEIIQLCDTPKQSPTQFEKIRFIIDYDSYLTLKVDKAFLDKMAKSKKGSGKQLVEWVEDTISETSREFGRSWKIKGVKQQLEWQYLIHHYFYSQLNEILKQQSDKEYIDRIACYFTTLFMATSFSYGEEKKSNRDGKIAYE